MGQLATASCSCGYSQPLRLGGVRSNYLSVFGFPYVCHECKSVFTGNLFESSSSCIAQNRNKQRRCLNPAAFGCKTCRYHGARRQIAEGTNHPNYKHGNRSQVAIKSFQGAMKALDEVEDMAESIGMVASRRRGRRSR